MVSAPPGGPSAFASRRCCRSVLLVDQRSEYVPVVAGDDIELDALRADRRALADVGAAAEALGVVLVDHAERAGAALGLALRQQSPRWATFAAVNSIAEAFGQAATHAPQPMQAAASIARVGVGLGDRRWRCASGAAPVVSEM